MAKKDEYRNWFLGLEREDFQELCRSWNSNHLGVEIPELDGYDEWLNFFKKLSPNAVENLYDLGKDALNTEAFAALARWKDIIETPGRIDKIYQAGLTKKKTEQKSIVELAKDNDKLGVLYAVRDQIAEKLEKGTGARETASLAGEMSAILDQITQAERQAGPKKDTLLADLLANKPKKSKGARNGSFKAHTIAEVEANGD